MAPIQRLTSAIGLRRATEGAALHVSTSPTSNMPMRIQTACRLRSERIDRMHDTAGWRTKPPTNLA